jgi:cyclopropane fatty-acyl-phospholipid synthase-like methyltransferase
MEETDTKHIVADGYDNIAEQHEEWAGKVRIEERAKYTSILLDKLPEGADVLELGCGSGTPTTQQLAEKFSVTGVDISAKQVELAQQRVPAAKFIHSDMTQLDLAVASFDAVAAFYSVIHVPRHEQAELFRKISSWLRPGGLLVTTMGANSIEAYYSENFLGQPMYWSHFDSETNRRIIQQARFSIISAIEETADEFGEPVTFLWVVAKKSVTT